MGGKKEKETRKGRRKEAGDFASLIVFR